MNSFGAIDLFFPPEYLRAAQILSLFTVWVLVGIYAYLNRYTKRRYFSIWTGAWLFYALWLTLGIRFMEDGQSPLIQMLSQWSLGASAVCLLWGSAQFLGETAPQRLYGLFTVFLMAWGYLGAWHLDHSLHQDLPIFVVLGLASAWTAWAYWRVRRRLEFVGASLLVLGFGLWGIYLLALPILRMDPYLVSPAFFLSAVIQMLIAISLIVLVLEELRVTALNAAEALRNSENRCRMLTMSAPVGIVEFAPDGSLRFANERWQAWFGPSSKEQNGLGWLARVVESQRGEIEDRLRELLDRDKVFQEEFVAETRAGEQRTFLAQSVPLHREDGAIAGQMLTFADVSALKEAEAERQRLEAQLRQSQKMETVGTLAGGIAHGFNNLLQPIIGFAGLAKQSLPPDSSAHNDLDYIVRGARRAKELTRQLLTFSRQGDQERLPLQLQLVVGEALQLVRASIPENVEIARNIDADCPPVLVDAGQLNQVVMNLCTNAFHALKGGSGRIGVSLDTVDVREEQADRPEGVGAGVYVRFSVEDDGGGMDEATRERVFEPFFTTKEKGEGTGLGLSVVHGIVESHGGSIDVKSRPGEGTRIDVYLPATDLPAEETHEGETLETEGTERILFVDDEEDVAHLCAKVLERLGYSITAMTSSLEARAVLEANPDAFDLVITDQVMPGLSGQNLAETVLNYRADLPMIMITGYGNLLTLAESRAIGFHDYLMKPVEPRDLGCAVRRVLDNRHRKKEA